MNGVHDLGGMQGHGQVKREKNEPVFHAAWEGRVRAMMTAGLRLGLFNLDEFRWAVERMDPAAYLAASYYEKWLAAIERLYVEKGAIKQEELKSRETKRLSLLQSSGNPALHRLLTPPGSESHARPSRPPQFTAGDRVVAKNIHSCGHTRLPRYVRGKRGLIHRLHGSYALPDQSAMGLGQFPEYVYSVRFAARELWGGDAPENDVVFIDLWESYLERGR